MITTATSTTTFTVVTSHFCLLHFNVSTWASSPWSASGAGSPGNGSPLWTGDSWDGVSGGLMTTDRSERLLSLLLLALCRSRLRSLENRMNRCTVNVQDGAGGIKTYKHDIIFNSYGIKNIKMTLSELKIYIYTTGLSRAQTSNNSLICRIDRVNH